jgi:general nucleoside transport system permease protein
MDLFNAFIVVLASGVRLAIPLILACLAGLWSERSGIVDIGLEGKILVGAFASALGATFTGSVWAGLAFGVA